MNFKFTLLALLIVLSLQTAAQTDSLKITYDATLSGDSCQPLGVNKMYFHSGAGTSSPLAAWEHIVGNFTQDDGLGQMSPTGTTDLWTITIHLYDYYDQTGKGTTIYGIGAGFRNENGTVSGWDDDCQDIFIRQLETGNPIVENSSGSAFAGVTAEYVQQVGVDDLSGMVSNLRTFPNPFTDAISINYTLNEYNTDLRLAVYNALGQMVRVLHSGTQPVGTHNMSWDGRDASGNRLSSGVYFFSISSGSTAVTHKIIKTN